MNQQNKYPLVSSLGLEIRGYGMEQRSVVNCADLEAHTDHCEIMTYRRPCSCHVKECADTAAEIESKLGGL